MKPFVTLIGLNPSTADAMKDDNTIRKEMGFARRWGCGGLLKLNVYAFRATQPRDLQLAAHPIHHDSRDGSEKYWRAFGMIKPKSMVVCCWGSTEVLGYRRQPRMIIDHISRIPGIKLRAFQLNKSGSPKHPLYVSYKTKLVHYRGVNL